MKRTLLLATSALLIASLLTGCGLLPQQITPATEPTDNTVTVDRSPDGARLVTCAVQDCGKTLFSVTLRVADAHQEETVRENFLNDPTLLYRSALAVLTGDAGLRRAGSQIVIDL